MNKIIYLKKWIRKQKKFNKIKASRTSINKITEWKFNKKKIFHKTNNFFSISAFEFKQKRLKKTWVQPLIIQREVGILGIIKKKIKNLDYYLLQAKSEPGNINGVQFSPTVQATKSNYLRKHKGKKTPYLNFFQKKKIALI